MKTESDKKHNREYMVIVTIQFPIYFSKKEEDDGTEIPSEMIREQIIKAVDNGHYDIVEEPID